MTLTPDELLTTTRSVRKRLDLERPVPMEIVRECLEIALHAFHGQSARLVRACLVGIAARELEERIRELILGGDEGDRSVAFAVRRRVG